MFVSANCILRNDVHILVGRRGKYLLNSFLQDCSRATHKCYEHVTQLWQGSHQVSSYLVVTATMYTPAIRCGARPYLGHIRNRDHS